MKTKFFLTLIPSLGLLALAACKSTTSTPQMTNRPDFLTTYNHLRKVDATTWRYSSPPLLAGCNKFIVSPVKVLIKEFDGKPVTAEQQQRTADFVRQAIIIAVGDHYPIVYAPGPDVAEIRVALTEAYRTGDKLGLCVEGEILDNSKTQVGAVVRTELSEKYVSDWENKSTARQMVDEWSKRLCKVIDEAHAKM